MENTNFDLVVIGAGPGGYVAAIRAAQLGFRVGLVDKRDTLGGTCLNVGCIPSKALLESSELYHEANHLANHGVVVGEVKLDLARMMARKDQVVKGLVTGIAGLIRKNKIEWLKGTAHIPAVGKVEITPNEGGTPLTVETGRILIATGSVPSPLPGVTFDDEVIVSSDQAISFPRVPEHLVVIGGGVIGLELGSVWHRLGAKVTVLEYLPRILAGMDDELAKAAQRIFSRQGLEFQLGARVTGATRQGDRATVTFEHEGQQKSLECDRLLVCVGRRPFTAGLGLEALGVAVDKGGKVVINDHFETNIPGIWAIGDVVRGAMLAHKAEEEGVAAVERMAGQAGHVNYLAIPGVVYTWPEVASVGYTEEELQKAGRAYKKGSFPFMANGRAKAMAATDGWTKILTDAQTERILGAHIIGPRAGDLIAELTLATEFQATADDIARTSHAHPSLAEVVKEAALAVDGRVIHI